MAVETKIASALNGSSAVTAQCSTRIYPMAIPQGVTAFPALVYQRGGSRRVSSLSGYSNLENPTIEVTSWATSYATAKGLSTAAQAAVLASTAYAAVLSGDEELYEPGMEGGPTWGVTLFFSIWNRE